MAATEMQLPPKTQMAMLPDECSSSSSNAVDYPVAFPDPRLQLVQPSTDDAVLKSSLAAPRVEHAKSEYISLC